MRNKPTRLEKQLHDTLLNITQALYADGPRQKDLNRCNRALGAFERKFRVK